VLAQGLRMFFGGRTACSLGGRAPIAAANSLRHDPLKAQFASVGEHDRALTFKSCAELDDACDGQF
jgi:hypothetical protein